jgi:uncharacterized protein (DUF58 family)
MPLFEADFLAQLEYLSLVSRRTFRENLLAQRRPSQVGGGVEFADHRDYTPGDDYRHLDWNVYARLGNLLLKRFQEERDLRVYFLLDASASMGCGRPPKFDLARRVAAALAYIALADLDRVAVFSAAGERAVEFPLTRGKGRVLALLRFLEGLAADGPRTDLAALAGAFLARGPRPGVVVVLSDLYDPSGFERGLDLLRHHRFDLHLVQVHDRKEADPGLAGDVELVDVETGERRRVTVNDRAARRYREEFQRFLDSIDGYCRRYGLGCVTTPADVPLRDLVLRMMQAAVVR